jgi:hypothetical protein
VNQPATILQNKITELLQWERRKRREQALALLLFHSMLAALLVAPFYSQFAGGRFRWFIPVLLLAAGAPFFFVKARWRRADSARALVRVDKSLQLDERVLTAWEVLERDQARGAALLVMKEAAEKLATVNPKMLFRRTWSWQAYSVLPLLILWLGVVWLDIAVQSGATTRLSAPTLARRLEEFSRSLHERATSERLPETLHLSRDLAEVARKGIESETEDEEIRAELAGVMKKIELATKSAAAQATFSAGESRQYLNDLQAELESARDLFNPPPGAEKTRSFPEQWLDGLAPLPRLKRQFDQAGQSGSMGQSQLQSFLDQIQKQVTGELDRRALLDAQQFLEQMSRQSGGEPGESIARRSGKGEDGSPEDGARNNHESSTPGHEAGNHESGSPSLPDFKAGGATQLKGSLGAGQSGGIPLKGKPAAGTSAMPEKEVIASYRRQAEAELESERVPEALKETIKKYFLSLDESTRQR